MQFIVVYIVPESILVDIGVSEYKSVFVEGLRYSPLRMLSSTKNISW